ncbi:Lsm family RNA-binding protein [Candidatus Bathyarchaeota archaeon]|nr:Lsm family RNA-binding protein [Candidatus Bathyarchaeota archaeon]
MIKVTEYYWLGGHVFMSSVAERRFREELTLLIQKVVTVHTSTGKTYTGTLYGMDANTLNMCLGNVRDESGKEISRMFINGRAILEVYGLEMAFDLRSLGERLERVFPKMVKVIDEAGVIVVMDKIRVGEKGVIEGRGPAAERVQKVYDEFTRERARPP